MGFNLWLSFLPPTDRRPTAFRHHPKTGAVWPHDPRRCNPQLPFGIVAIIFGLPSRLAHRSSERHSPMVAFWTRTAMRFSMPAPKALAGAACTMLPPTFLLTAPVLPAVMLRGKSGASFDPYHHLRQHALLITNLECPAAAWSRMLPLLLRLLNTFSPSLRRPNLTTLGNLTPIAPPTYPVLSSELVKCQGNILIKPKLRAPNGMARQISPIASGQCRIDPNNYNLL